MREATVKEVWRAVLGELQLQLPRTTFETWLKPTDGLSWDDHAIVVQAPSPFAVSWLERMMYQTIQKTVAKVANRPLEVHFQVAVGEDAHLLPEPQDERTGSTRNDNGQGPGRLKLDTLPFNPRYTFDSFVVGPSNRLAHSAAQAVADFPGQSYNPLFLYSGVGLGKTHLLHAIGQACANRGRSVIYVSSEQFTNDFISAIRNRTTEEFRNRYRGVQVLLIDDVQFMGGKEQTQEGFFHTFNDLHNSNHQIVLTSDRPPRALALLEDRLRSRFEWGLIADISAPDLETRMAILSYKARQMKIALDENVIELIGKRVQKNVRELEGSLNRVVAYAHLMKVPLTMDAISRILDDVTSDTARHAIEPDRILDEVSGHFKISAQELIGGSKKRKFAQARQVAMYLLIYELSMSPTEVGHLLGNRDHSTVTHGAGKINVDINENNQLRQDVLAIKEAIFT